MSILSHLFVADPADALRYEKEAAQTREPPSWVLGHAQFTELTDIQYEALWAASERRTWPADSPTLKELHMRADGGSWLFRFPPAFVAKLSEADMGNLDPMAEQWVRTGELHGATTAEVLPVVRELTRLALLAKSHGKGLFLWGSL
jgi:hypothetical protein